VPEQQTYRGTHRHRAPVGWHPPRIRQGDQDARDSQDGQSARNTQEALKARDAQDAKDAIVAVDTKPKTDAERDALPGEPTAPFTPTFTGEIPAVAEQPQSIPARPVATDEGSTVKRWTFVLVVAAVWVVAAVIGLALYYWWFHSIDKTPAVFVVLVYLGVCTVAALIASMAPGRPVKAALGIALMSAPFASTAAAAVLYGFYFCQHASRCLVGVIPY